MLDSYGKTIKKASPSTPVQILGISGAPRVGDKFSILKSEREAKEIANKRKQILREQSLKTSKRVSLEEISRRITIGSFKELNILIKGDVGGSIEAIADTLIPLSREEVKVSVVHKSVGAITESDVLLASVSKSLIIGFKVRPMASVKKIAEEEQVEIRYYNVIYDITKDIKNAIEGLLVPDEKQVIVGVLKILEIFKINKIGTIAGCLVQEGYVKKTSRIKIIRDGIVVYGAKNLGVISSLRHFKEEVKEVKNGSECGLTIKDYGDIRKDDLIEIYEIEKVKPT